MGFYTVVVFYNDNLSALDRPEAGPAIHRAISEWWGRDHESRGRPEILTGGGHVGQVVAQEHADTLTVLACSIGRGTKLLGHAAWDESPHTILKRLADDHGFSLHRKPRHKRRWVSKRCSDCATEYPEARPGKNGEAA